MHTLDYRYVLLNNCGSRLQLLFTSRTTEQKITSLVLFYLNVLNINQSHKVGLTISLALLWLLLSGHYTFFMISLGGIAIVLVILISMRMDVIDPEGQPFHFNLLGFFAYWYWLLKKIIEANIDVCILILRPSLPITPRFIEIQLQQASDLGRTIFANSITLTPGTVSVDVDQQTIVVHALSAETASALQQGDMNRRVAYFEKR